MGTMSSVCVWREGGTYGGGAVTLRGEGNRNRGSYGRKKGEGGEKENPGME